MESSPESFFGRSLCLASSLGQTCLAFQHLYVVFSTFCLSLMLSFITWSLSVWPPANLHMFIPVTTRFFTWELVTGTVCIPYSKAFRFSMMISLLADSFSEMRLVILSACCHAMRNRAYKDGVRWCHLTHQLIARASVHSCDP